MTWVMTSSSLVAATLALILTSAMLRSCWPSWDWIFWRVSEIELVKIAGVPSLILICELMAVLMRMSSSSTCLKAAMTVRPSFGRS